MDREQGAPIALAVPASPDTDFYIHLAESVKKLGIILCLQTFMLIPMFGYQLYTFFLPSHERC